MIACLFLLIIVINQMFSWKEPKSLDRGNQCLGSATFWFPGSGSAKNMRIHGSVSKSKIGCCKVCMVTLITPCLQVVSLLGTGVRAGSGLNFPVGSVGRSGLFKMGLLADLILVYIYTLKKMYWDPESVSCIKKVVHIFWSISL